MSPTWYRVRYVVGMGHLDDLDQITLREIQAGFIKALRLDPMWWEKAKDKRQQLMEYLNNVTDLMGHLDQVKYGTWWCSSSPVALPYWMSPQFNSRPIFFKGNSNRFHKALRPGSILCGK